MKKEGALSIVATIIGVASLYYILKDTWLGNAVGIKPFSKINPKGKTIAFFGDSYTAINKYGWQSVLAKKYGFTEVNKAKGGVRTDYMLKEAEAYLATNKPDYIMILGGANDAYSFVTIDAAVANVQKIVDLANSKGVKPIVVAGYNSRKGQVGNVRQKPNSWQLNQGITQEKLWGMGEKYYQIQSKQKGIKGAIYVPTWDGISHNDLYDGLHMTWDANTKFADHVGKYLFTDPK